MQQLRFRQVHLDFHTSPYIPAIGAAFDKGQFQDALKRGHVDSITCFGICHHGWNYNDTSVGKRHPHLDFDLLRAQFEAAKEIDVNVPIYITAGISSRIGAEHPGWREITSDGGLGGWSCAPLEAGFKKLYFNSSYTDHLCELIVEIVRQFPDCDGVFLDIIKQGECCCEVCMDLMERGDLDPTNSADRQKMAQQALLRYYGMSTAAARCDNPDMPVFHNSGHITRGRRELLPFFSHLELESLPTGHWGYDHFPMSAKYCGNLQHDRLGMTGKFHTTWGEFGGYKHPNALRYECAAMLAYGAKCSVGDQLHPSGRMDPSTYANLGVAYAEVEEKEPWCVETTNIADIAVLSCEAVNGRSDDSAAADEGATRILLEGHFLFDVIDADMPLDGYSIIILPDSVVVDNALVGKLNAFTASGGRLLLTSMAGQLADGQGQAFDIGARGEGGSPHQPDYIVPIPELAPDFVSEPIVMYLPSQRITASDGATSLGKVWDPYFTRSYRQYCSHQHAPPQTAASGYDCGTLNPPYMYLAHPVFTLYRASGAVALKHYVTAAIRKLLGDACSLTTSLPSTARVSLMAQPQQNRYVLHLLFANTVNRGGPLSAPVIPIPLKPVEVIEDLLPLRQTQLSVRLPEDIKRVSLEPQGEDLAFAATAGTVQLEIDEFTCHQMVVLHY